MAANVSNGVRPNLIALGLTGVVVAIFVFSLLLFTHRASEPSSTPVHSVLGSSTLAMAGAILLDDLPPA